MHDSPGIKVPLQKYRSTPRIKEHRFAFEDRLDQGEGLAILKPGRIGQCVVGAEPIGSHPSSSFGSRKGYGARVRCSLCGLRGKNHLTISML